MILSLLYPSEMRENFRILFILLSLEPLSGISMALLDHSSEFNTFSFDIPNVFHLLSGTRCVSNRYGFVDDDNRVNSTTEEKRISEDRFVDDDNRVSSTIEEKRISEERFANFCF
jgi:hypothetical protein